MSFRRDDCLRQWQIATLAFELDNPAWYTDNSSVFRDITHVDKGIGADTGMVTDGYRAEDDGAGTDEYVVADRRVTFAFVFSGATEGDVVEEDAVIPDLDGFPDNDAMAVIDEESSADFRSGMDLDTGEESRCLRNEAGDQAELDFVEGMSYSMPDNSMQACIKKYLQSASRWIVAVNRPDVVCYFNSVLSSSCSSLVLLVGRKTESPQSGSTPALATADRTDLIDLDNRIDRTAADMQPY
jgi:hypothetical protein